MNIGDTIKKLRLKKEMTQEQLAEYLNISSQAVSKWETNLSLPDITLIPMLANIFEVSSDTLLGIDIAEKEKRIADIIKRAEGQMSKGYHDAAADILKSGLKEYPNSYEIMSVLTSSLYCLRQLRNVSKEEKDTANKEAVRLAEKILAECTDDQLRNNAIQLLCYVYPEIGETEKAEALAEKMSPPHVTREHLLLSVYKGNKRHKFVQESLFNNAMGNILGYLDTCNRVPLDDGNYPYTIEEDIVISKKSISIIEIMLENGNYGYYEDWIARKYYFISLYYAQLKDYGNAVESLNLCADHSIKFDTEYDPEKEYTALLFRGMKSGPLWYQTPNNSSMDLLELMDSPIFNPIRGNAEFIEIVDRLKKYAKKR